MTELISLLLALVRSDEQLESVSEQQFLRDVRAEVATPSSESVGAAAFLHFGITPQYIHDLQPREKTYILSTQHSKATLTERKVLCPKPTPLTCFHSCSSREGEGGGTEDRIESRKGTWRSLMV